jgi:hypothetical protein
VRHWPLLPHPLLSSQINETVTDELPFRLDFNTISMFKFRMQAQMEEQWRVQREWGQQKEGDTEMLKQMLLETKSVASSPFPVAAHFARSPYLLGVTFFVSILHTVFDCLAFKNDIAFWKG